jgi:hypothetical protein
MRTVGGMKPEKTYNEPQPLALAAAVTQVRIHGSGVDAAAGADAVVL